MCSLIGQPSIQLSFLCVVDYLSGDFMSSAQQPFFAANKANIEQVVAIQNRLFAGFEQLVDANMQAMKTSLADFTAQVNKASEVGDIEQANQLAVGVVKPSSEQAFQYSKEVFEIFASMQRDLGQMTEANVTQHQQQLNQFIEQAQKTAPAGSESFFALLKSGVQNMSNATESAVKVSRQFADVAESNLSAARTAAANASQQATSAVEQTIAKAATAAKAAR